MSSFRGDIDQTRFLNPEDVLSIVLENIAHGIAVVDKDYRLVAFNRMMNAIFQLPEDTFRIGLDFRRVLEIWARQTGQTPEMLALAIRNLDERQTFVFEHDQDIHGETRWVQLIHTPLPGGGFVRTFMDITERKRAELALREAVDDLREANAAKDQFLRLVSHDLRSPIAGLVGLLQLMLDFGDLGADKQRELLEEGVSGASSLLSLTDHLLKVSRITSGAIIPHKRPTSLLHLITDIHNRHKLSLRQKGIECRIDMDPDLQWLADRVLLGQVFDNLFSNAVKFCDSGDQIRIRQTARDQVEFTDTGPGVPEKFRCNLFRHEVKTRAQGSRGESGTGLGMPHCADIMTAHGGEIRLLSRERGAGFVVHLPHHSHSVLIVDDQAAHRAMIRTSINGVGSFNILEAANGKDALDLLETFLPQIAVIDLEMPDIDGRQLLKTLRTRERTRHLPIIVASSHLHGAPQEANRLKSELLRMGADHVEVKPIHTANFNQSFLRLLQR